MIAFPDPSETAHNGRGRDTCGRFAAGNKIAKGNPQARKMARLRGALLRTVTIEDIQEIVTTLLKLAKEGDVQAAKIILERVLGKPDQSLDVMMTATTPVRSPEEIRAQISAEIDAMHESPDMIDFLHDKALAESHGLLPEGTSKPRYGITRRARYWGDTEGEEIPNGDA